MNFYRQQLQKIARDIYPNEGLCRQVVQAKLFIDRHYADDLPLKAIAARAHLSPFHFIRLFKSLYGQTPHQYLMCVRIEKAKQLLRAGVPVTEACLSAGFSSPTSFTALFKKMTGYTPSSLQQAHELLKKQQF